MKSFSMLKNAKGMSNLNYDLLFLSRQTLIDRARHTQDSASETTMMRQRSKLKVKKTNHVAEAT